MGTFMVSNSTTSSCITAHGELVDKFRYIDQLKSSVFKEQSKNIGRDAARARRRAEAEEKGVIVELDGHLFDSGLINNVLDLMEASGCEVDIIKMKVCSSGAEGRSNAVLRVTGDKKDEVVEKVKDLVPLLPTAAATCSIHGRKGIEPQAVVTDMSQKRVLLLGAGKVANSFAEYVGRRDDRKVVVAGNVESEVRSVAAEARHGEGVCFDVTANKEKLAGLIKESDIVISLLPAPFHPMVGDMCINNGINMVTASYVSPAVREVRACE